MEDYEKKISFLGENIQTIRKHRGMKQQELADKIGINMQSLSKIERGVNYPTFDTLEKIMDVLGVTPLMNYCRENGWKSYGNILPTTSTELEELMEIRPLSNQRIYPAFEGFKNVLDRYDDLYSMDMFGESIEGHKYRTPYQVVKMINPNSKEDMELLREVLKNNHFDDEDE